MTINEKRDYKKWYMEIPEDGFNPARNRRVIDQTIKKYEETRRRKSKEWLEMFKERSDAVATYLTSRHGLSQTVERYFGKRTLAYLRGEDIVNMLRGNVFLPKRKLFKDKVN